MLCLLVVGIIYTMRPKPIMTHTWTRFERTGTTLDGWVWARLPWTGDDKPYQQIIADVNKALYAGQKPDAVIAGYKAKADVAPKDPHICIWLGLRCLESGNLGQTSTSRNTAILVIYRML